MVVLLFENDHPLEGAGEPLRVVEGDRSCEWPGGCGPEFTPSGPEIDSASAGRGESGGARKRGSRRSETEVTDGTGSSTPGMSHEELCCAFPPVAASEVAAAGVSIERVGLDQVLNVPDLRPRSREPGLELRPGRSRSAISYPPAACCRLRRRSPEWPLLLARDASEKSVRADGLNRHDRVTPLSPCLEGAAAERRHGSRRWTERCGRKPRMRDPAPCADRVPLQSASRSTSNSSNRSKSRSSVNRAVTLQSRHSATICASKTRLPTAPTSRMASISRAG